MTFDWEYLWARGSGGTLGRVINAITIPTVNQACGTDLENTFSLGCGTRHVRATDETGGTRGNSGALDSVIDTFTAWTSNQWTFAGGV